MRWEYLNPEDVDDFRQRAQMLGRIDLWWSAFSSRARDLDDHFTRGKEMDVPAWMAENLQVLDERLMWEFGPGRRGGHRLVITPETERQLRPMVRTMLHRAPQLNGWEFYGYRLAEDLEAAQGCVKGRTGGDLADVKASVVAGKGHLIDLCFYSPRCSGPGDKQAANDAFVAAESLLGEQTLDEWIGEIGVARTPDPGTAEVEGMVDLESLHGAVGGVQQRFLDTLPEDPRYLLDASQLKGVVYKLKPPEKDDYSRRLDLWVAQTTFPELWEAAHSGDLFNSRRFSRNAEIFCYLKIDGSQGVEQELFPDRSSMEDALDAKLKPAEAGAVFGGGTGLKYSYIDLALDDVYASIGIIRDVLRGGNISRRSWLLFFDDELASQWVGIWPDTPPPPGVKA